MVGLGLGAKAGFVRLRAEVLFRGLPGLKF